MISIRILKFFLLLIALLSFCACSVQENLDVCTFCKLYNHNYKENPLLYSTMIEEQDKGEKHIFINENNDLFLITFHCDSTGSITEISLTTDTENANTNTPLQAYAIFLQLSSVFTNESLSSTKTELEKLGVTPEVFSFEEKFLQFDRNRFSIFLCANNQHLTIYMQKQKSEVT